MCQAMRNGTSKQQRTAPREAPFLYPCAHHRPPPPNRGGGWGERPAITCRLRVRPRWTRGGKACRAAPPHHPPESSCRARPRPLPAQPESPPSPRPRSCQGRSCHIVIGLPLDLPPAANVATRVAGHGATRGGGPAAPRAGAWWQQGTGATVAVTGHTRRTKGEEDDRGSHRSTAACKTFPRWSSR